MKSIDNYSYDACFKKLSSVALPKFVKMIYQKLDKAYNYNEI